MLIEERLIAQAASRAGGLSLDVNAKGFFALGNALLDASIATWNTKVVQDTVRPVTYIRWLYKAGRSKAGAGPGSTKAVTEHGPNWVLYQEPNVGTPPSGSNQRAQRLLRAAQREQTEQFRRRSTHRPSGAARVLATRPDPVG